MALRVGISTHDFVLADWDRVALIFWRGRTTVAGLHCADRYVGELVERRKNFALILTVVDPGAPLPPFEARGEISKCLQRGNGRVERSAVVFEGDWIRAASVRAIVAGVALFAAPNYPHRYFSDLVAALHFLGVEQLSPDAVQNLTQLLSTARRAPPTSSLPEGPVLDERSKSGWSI
jgi:hypothetical protein